MNLSSEQYAAVNDPAPSIRCISGAGSGKTRVLTARAAKLIDDGACPSSLMLVTFTRKAAAEMRERIATMVRDAEGMMCDTFHAIALHILKAEARELPIPYDPDRITVLNEEAYLSMILDVCTELGYRTAEGNWRGGVSKTKAVGWLEHYYSTGDYPREPQAKNARGGSRRKNWPKSRSTQPMNLDAKRIIDEVHIRMIRSNSVSYGLLMVKALELMRIPSVRDRWLGQIKHVLVDEAQDCNALQWQFVRAFSPPATLYVVGDPRQSIFGWRGASPDGMAAVLGSYHSITTSYRCPTRILDVANRLLKGHDDLTAAKSGGVVTLLPAGPDETYEPIARFISIGPLMERGGVAVLARTHQTLRYVEAELKLHDIPTHRVGSASDITRSKEFQDVLAILTLAANPRNEWAFNRVRTICGMGEAEYREVRYAAQAEGVAPLHCIRLYKYDRILYACCRELTDQNPMIDDALNVIQAMGQYGIQMAIVLFWLDVSSRMTVREAVEWYSFREAADDTAGPDEVTLSTIHAAKGLEWPCVIVADCNMGDLPRTRTDAFDEEMRLVYVAVTRAQQVLALHTAGGHPSAFYEEVARKINGN